MSFLQGVSIACCTEPCTTYHLSVRLSQAGTVSKRRKLGLRKSPTDFTLGDIKFIQKGSRRPKGLKRMG